jgi:hypothetical protein
LNSEPTRREEVAERIGGVGVAGRVVFDLAAADVDAHLDALDLLRDQGGAVRLDLIDRPGEEEGLRLVLDHVAAHDLHVLLGVGGHLLVEGLLRLELPLQRGLVLRGGAGDDARDEQQGDQQPG